MGKEHAANLLLKANVGGLRKMHQIQDSREEVSLWEILHKKQVSSFHLRDINLLLHQVATDFKNPKIAHGILTPERIRLFVERNQEQQIISIQFSRIGDLCLDSCRHLRWYMAPEALVGSLTTEKSHVWSLACIAAEMFLGFPTAYCDYEMIWNITQTQGLFPDHVLNAGSKTKEFYSKSGSNQWLLKTPREYGKNIPKDVKFFSPEDFRKLYQKSGICSKTEQTDVEHFVDLIKQMLALDPAKRINLNQVLQHPFVAVNRQHFSSLTKTEDKDAPHQSGIKSSLDNNQRQRLSENREVPTVWIIGSGYYITGAENTANRCFGENFGVNAKIRWIGKVNMRWRDVLKNFYSELSQQSSSPDILVLHVGSNDLGNTNVLDLVNKMLKDLTHLHQAFPKMKIAYSCIIPRLAGGTFDPRKQEDDRMTVNKNMLYSAGLFNGAVMEHPKLTPFESQLFKPGGIHFTSKGFEVFVTSIRDTIEQTLRQTFSSTVSSTSGLIQPGPKPNLKRKVSSEDISQSTIDTHLSPTKKKKVICENDSQDGQHKLDFKNLFATPLTFVTEIQPENPKPNLKRKVSSEDLSLNRVDTHLSPTKKKKVICENDRQHKPDFKSRLANPPTTVTQIQPEKKEEDTSSSPDLSFPADSSPMETHKVTGRPDVWIVGSSYISQAQPAATHLFGQNFNLDAKVKWIGMRDMGWREVVDNLHHTISKEDGPPEVLVIHAGGKELGQMPPQQIANQMVQDLRLLRQMYPQMRIVLSLIIPRKSRKLDNLFQIDKSRTVVKNIMKWHTDLFNVVVEHQDLLLDDEKMYRLDGVTLTLHGNQIFLNNIRTAIQKCLQ